MVGHIKNGMPPVHPGEILQAEVLEPLKMSANRLAQELRVPATRIGDILHGRRGITADTALRLGRFLNTSPQFWMNLQTSYDIKLAEQALMDRLEREVTPREVA